MFQNAPNLNPQARKLNAFEAVAQTPFSCFSAFANDLAAPLCLMQLQPAPEVLSTGPTGSDAAISLKNIPNSLLLQQLNLESFDLSNIVLNQPAPNAEDSHEYDDEFMLTVMNTCYNAHLPKQHRDTARKPIAPATSAALHPQMTIPEPKSGPNKADSTPLKLKLTLTSTSARPQDLESLLKNMLLQEVFVPVVCFDCVDDLLALSKLERTLLAAPTIDKDSAETLKNLVADFSTYVSDYFECIERDSSEANCLKNLYCMALIGIMNAVSVLCSPVLTSFHPLAKLCDLYMSLEGENQSGASLMSDTIVALTFETYTAIVSKFRLDGSELASLLSQCLAMFFDKTFANSAARAALFQLASVIFAKYPDMHSLVIDQVLANATDQPKLAWSLLLGSLSAFAASQFEPAAIQATISAHLSSILDYFWKSDNPDWISKSSASLSFWVDELLALASDPTWPLSCFILNYVTVQIFYASLREDTTKTPIPLKLKLLDVLTTIATVLAAPQSAPKQSFISSNLANLSYSPAFAGIFSVERIIKNAGSFYAVLSEKATVSREQLLQFIGNGPLSKVPERTVGLLVKLISSDATLIRSKAIKNLHCMMTLPANNLMNNDALRRSILGKATDPSISVRDAVLDFISKLILSEGSATDNTELIEATIARIKDMGVTVRKRAVKILGDVLQKQIAVGSTRILCIASLLSHAPTEEDDIVQDMVSKTLRSQWLDQFAGEGFNASSALNQKDILERFATEMLLLMNALGSNVDCLKQFYSDLLESLDSRNRYDSFFTGIIDVLLERLLKALEANDQTATKQDLEAVSLFALSKSEVLEQHLPVFQTLLRSDDLNVSFLSLRLLASALPKASMSSMKRLQGLEADLQTAVLRGSEMAVRLAIESLYSYINNCTHQYGLLSSLWQKFTEYLKLQRDSEAADVAAVPHICRALVALGVLCAQSGIHMETEFGSKDYHHSPQVCTLLEFVEYYRQSPHTAVRACSFQSIGSVILACPAVCHMDQVRFLISCALADAEDPCKLKILSIFDQICSKFSEGQLAGAENTADVNRILSIQGKESFFCSLIQSNISSICGIIATTGNAETQTVILRICSSSAILGLVNPQQTLPTIIVGSCSPYTYLRDFSRNSLDRIMNRFPSMVCKDFVDIGRILFRMSLAAGRDPKGFAEDIHSESLSHLCYYYEYLRNKKGRATDFLASVFLFLDKLISPGSQVDGIGGLAQFVPLLLGLLITLPFSSTAEVLYLLQKIQEVYSVALNSVESHVQGVSLELIYLVLVLCDYSAGYLIRSYPAVVGMSVGSADPASNATKEKSCPRSAVKCEMPSAVDTLAGKTLDRAFLLDFINGLAPVPTLLSEAPIGRLTNTGTNGRGNTRRGTGPRSSSADEVEGYLVDDATITSSEEDSDVSEEIMVVSERARFKDAVISQSTPVKVSKSNKPAKKASTKRAQRK